MVLSRQQNAVVRARPFDCIWLGARCTTQAWITGGKNIQHLIFLCLPVSDIESLGNNAYNVPLGHKRLVTAFFDYVTNKIHKGEPIKVAWTALTADDFDGFRSSDESLCATQGYGTVANFDAAPSGSGYVAPASRSMNAEELSGDIDPATKKVLHRSSVRPVVDETDPNLHVDRHGGEDSVSPNVQSGTCDGAGRPDTTPDNTPVVLDEPSEVSDDPEAASVFAEDVIGKTCHEVVLVFGENLIGNAMRQTTILSTSISFASLTRIGEADLRVRDPSRLTSNKSNGN